MATGILQKGQTFADGGIVNAASLNNLVDLGDVLAGLISSKSPATPLTTDYVLFLDAGSNLRKAQFSTLPTGVTSVGLTMPTTEYTVTGSPVTGSGTLATAWKPVPKNTGLFGPITGSNAAPAFRRPVSADLASPSVNISSTVIDWNLGTNFWKALPNSLFTISFSNATDGAAIRVLLTSGGTSTAVTWPTMYWSPHNTPPIQPAVAGGTALYVLQQINAAIIGLFYQIVP